MLSLAGVSSTRRRETVADTQTPSVCSSFFRASTATGRAQYGVRRRPPDAVFERERITGKTTLSDPRLRHRKINTKTGPNATKTDPWNHPAFQSTGRIKLDGPCGFSDRRLHQEVGIGDSTLRMTFSTNAHLCSISLQA